MASPASLTWAMRPDPDLGTCIVAVWTVDDGSGTGAVETLEIDLMGHARRVLDRDEGAWIPILDDAPDVTFGRNAEITPIHAQDQLLAQPGEIAV